MFEKLLNFFRVREWYDSKIPMMISVFLYFYFLNTEQFSTKQFYIHFFCYFIYLAAFLAFSYLINDYSDMDVDYKAGKEKIILHVPKAIVVAAMLFLILFGNLPLLILVDWNVICVGLSAALYFLGAAYSVKGFRFKEKGLIGLLECSVAQKCFPVLLVPFLIKVDIIPFLLWLLLLFVDGLRYIIIHQVIDVENDIKTGVVTYVSSGKTWYKKGMLAAVALEILLVCLLFSQIVMEHWQLWLFVIYYFVNEWIIGKVICSYLRKAWLYSFEAVPLEDLFNVYIPILLLCGIAFQVPPIWFLVLGGAVYLFGGLKCKMVFVNIYIQSKLKGEVR